MQYCCWRISNTITICVTSWRVDLARSRYAACSEKAGNGKNNWERTGRLNCTFKHRNCNFRSFRWKIYHYFFLRYNEVGRRSFIFELTVHFLFLTNFWNLAISGKQNDKLKRLLKREKWFLFAETRGRSRYKNFKNHSGRMKRKDYRFLRLTFEISLIA